MTGGGVGDGVGVTVEQPTKVINTNIRLIFAVLAIAITPTQNNIPHDPTAGFTIYFDVYQCTAVSIESHALVSIA